MFMTRRRYAIFFFEFWEMLTASSLLTIKGAPDILIERCTNIVLPDGNVIPLTEDGCNAVKQLKDQWSSEGKRVILLARKILHEDEESIVPADPETKMLNEIRNGLTLVGLISIIDPPRPEIPDVVSTLRGAGIRVFMVRLGPGKGTPFIWRSCFDGYHRLLAIME
jgi:magnesium-transporting ATPase (P-type)